MEGENTTLTKMRNNFEQIIHDIPFSFSIMDVCLALVFIIVLSSMTLKRRLSAERKLYIYIHVYIYISLKAVM